MAYPDSDSRHGFCVIGRRRAESRDRSDPFAPAVSTGDQQMKIELTGASVLVALEGSAQSVDHDDARLGVDLEDRRCEPLGLARQVECQRAFEEADGRPALEAVVLTPGPLADREVA